MTKEETLAQMEEALSRLKAAHEGEFPMHVKLNLLIEAVIAFCEDQTAMHYEYAELCRTFKHALLDYPPNRHGS